MILLVLGLFVVNAAGAIIVLYANHEKSLKELGSGMLGLEKRHLILDLQGTLAFWLSNHLSRCLRLGPF